MRARLNEMTEMVHLNGVGYSFFSSFSVHSRLAGSFSLAWILCYLTLYWPLKMSEWISSRRIVVTVFSTIQTKGIENHCLQHFQEWFYCQKLFVIHQKDNYRVECSISFAHKMKTYTFIGYDQLLVNSTHINEF